MSSEIERLKRENGRLKKELEKVLEEKDKILEEKKKIEKEFTEFKAAHNVTVDHLQAALHIKPERKHSGKGIGAQKGHTGYSRHIPERIDFIKPLNVTSCPYCNNKLKGEVVSPRTRTVTDIKLVTETINTRYELKGKWCPTCKKVVYPDIPGVLPRARFGINLMLLIMYLRLGLRLPGNKVCEYFQTLHNISISGGEIVNILRKLAIVYGPYYTTLEKLLRLARVKQTDSTSWRINGKNYFAWVFIATGVVLYKIRKRNNHKVPLSVLGKAHSNDTLVVDRHSAFRKLAKKAGYKIQLCWSHILEDSRELKHNFGAEGKYVHKILKDIYAQAKSLNHKGTPEHVEQLQGAIFELTNRHYKHSTIRRFVNALAFRDIDNLFRFVTDSNIDSTNNLSERELRALVIIRKISNGSKSIKGANTTAMLLSIIQTLRLNKQNPLIGLQTVLSTQQS